MRLAVRIFPTLFIILAMVAAGFASAHADVVQTVRFSQAPTVFVWDADGQVQSGQTLVLQSFPVFEESSFPGSGQLQPIRVSFTNPAAKSNEFRFAIASNTGFTIKTTLMSDRGPVLVPVNVEVTQTAAKANTPILSRLDQGLHRVSGKTAREAGRPIEQSVEFLASWDGAPGTWLIVDIEAK